MPVGPLITVAVEFYRSIHSANWLSASGQALRKPDILIGFMPENDLFIVEMPNSVDLTSRFAHSVADAA